MNEMKKMKIYVRYSSSRYNLWEIFSIQARLFIRSDTNDMDMPLFSSFNNFVPST